MSTSEIFLLLASVFAGGIAAFPVLATRNGWPQGSLFRTGQSGLIYLGIMVLGVIFLGVSAYLNKGSWWIVLWFIIIAFLGAPIVSSVFGRQSGMVAILGAVSCLAVGLITF